MKEIIHKYLKGSASDKEVTQLLDYLRDSAGNRSHFERIKADWLLDEQKQIPLSHLKAWHTIEDKLTLKSKSTTMLWLQRSASIAAVLLVFIGIAFVFQYASRQMVVFSTAEQQNVKVTLPDSTIVHLNENSSLSYNQWTYALLRDIDLKGEAFFDVRHKQFSQFNVNIDKVNVTVLGTRFNVKEGTSNELEVVLQSGIVELSMDGSDFKKRLKPGQRAILNKSKQRIMLDEVNADLHCAWMEGVIHCKDMGVEEFFANIEKAYDITVRIDNDQRLKDLKITYTLKDDRIEDLIQILQLTLPLEIKIDKGLMNVKLDKTRYKTE
ncbi:MAG: FecR domain-containing protein [Carboxylicivirga sp.]|nr:FecR domain-containing protein [Carboxylicivirga sp.]